MEYKNGTLIIALRPSSKIPSYFRTDVFSGSDIDYDHNLVENYKNYGHY